MPLKDVQILVDLLRSRGHETYFGERVTVLEHSLQCAHFAEEAGSSPYLISAALLHDVGHLLHNESEDAAAQGQDTMHEELAAAYLADWFGIDVTEPIRLHVSAKRYLCAVDPAYLDMLSPTSVESLHLQGGPMSSAEVTRFQALPHAVAAVQLRRWDDQAKVLDFDVAGPEHYLEQLRAAATDPSLPVNSGARSEDR